MKKIKNSYKKSGVNISLANELVKHISSISKKGVKKTNKSFNKEVIGGFGSLFDISKIKISYCMPLFHNYFLLFILRLKLSSYCN